MKTLATRERGPALVLKPNLVSKGKVVLGLETGKNTLLNFDFGINSIKILIMSRDKVNSFQIQ